MAEETDYGQIDPFARNLIRKKAKQLIGKAGFTQTDRDDIEQDLYLKLLKQLPSFDSERGHHNAFVTTIVERYVATILRDRQAKKRNPHRVCSLNMVISDGPENSVELGNTIGSREQDARLGRAARSEEDLARLALDLIEVIATLPPDSCELLEALKTDSISEIARRQCVPRTTLNEQVRRLRRRFEQAELRDYLAIPSSGGPPTG